LNFDCLEEWDSIPEIEDYTVKKKKYNRITPVPDSLIEQAAKDIETVNYIDPNQSINFEFRLFEFF
jgi:hypothetical protein